VYLGKEMAQRFDPTAPSPFFTADVREVSLEPLAGNVPLYRHDAWIMPAKSISEVSEPGSVNLCYASHRTRAARAALLLVTVVCKVTNALASAVPVCVWLRLPEKVAVTSAPDTASPFPSRMTRVAAPFFLRPSSEFPGTIESTCGSVPSEPGPSINRGTAEDRALVVKELDVIDDILCRKESCPVLRLGIPGNVPPTARFSTKKWG
jgi:hypothetical protein